MSTVTEFKMPTLHPMDRVMVSQDPTWASPIPGWITRVKSNGADIAVLALGRVMLFHDSMYFDDPRVKERPHLFDDGDRGVFRLAQSEEDQRAVMSELSSQRDMLDQLVADVAAMSPPAAPEIPVAPKAPKTPRKSKAGM